MIKGAFLFALSLFCLGCVKRETFPYRAWNLEKTVLIDPAACLERKREHFDLYVAVDSRASANLENCARVVTKPDWDTVDAEIPSQIYDIRNRGNYTTFRIAFNLNLLPCKKQRVGILYDNPGAQKKDYKTDLAVSEKGNEWIVENSFYKIKILAQSGRISHMAVRGGQFGLLQAGETPLFSGPAGQEGAGVVFASLNEGRAMPAAVKKWEITVNRGPVFFEMIRRGRLSGPQGLDAKDAPRIEIRSRFFAGIPYFLVYSRLEFPSDARVYAIQNNMMSFDNPAFTHYLFRPVSPNLPLTDIEEMGHVMVDTAYTKAVPEGLLLAGLLPRDLAWQSYLNIDRKYSVVSINLLDSGHCPAGKPAQYRAASYAAREKGLVSWFNAPIYVGARDRLENAILVRKGTVYVRKDAVLIYEWEKEKWPEMVENLGRQLNNAPDVRQHPKTMRGPVPPPEFAALPAGSRADAYLRAGVR